ncbi:uncharacterized protein LOC129693405 [Leucoraja erinacea]|uniref:uncharacterized protein LOC129693405 n=1 Tax=Leucoraja erinaceus TaxID=7782 RepID=UPI0024588D4A|nr:uncharacterized protein LOC129693405 [Leucoraja erinacea]
MTHNGGQVNLVRDGLVLDESRSHGTLPNHDGTFQQRRWAHPTGAPEARPRSPVVWQGLSPPFPKSGSLSPQFSLVLVVPGAGGMGAAFGVLTTGFYSRSIEVNLVGDGLVLDESPLPRDAAQPRRHLPAAPLGPHGARSHGPAHPPCGAPGAVLAPRGLPGPQVGHHRDGHCPGARCPGAGGGRCRGGSPLLEEETSGEERLQCHQDLGARGKLNKLLCSSLRAAVCRAARNVPAMMGFRVEQSRSTSGGNESQLEGFNAG